MDRKQKLQERLTKVRQELGETKLVAVTKQTELEDIELMYFMGQKDFGENRVESLYERACWAQENGLKDIRWHFIGNLQTNKINKLLKVPHLFAIHSIDSLRLLSKLVAKLGPEHMELKLFIQIKTSPEDEKSGLEDIDQVREAIDLGRERVLGLMTMAPIRVEEQESAARQSFQKLVEWKNELSDPKRPDLQLSMGMSGDYKQAVKLGSDWVRLGRTLFSS
jgi:pyridoxal phosphate enzyme (YggS family)